MGVISSGSTLPKANGDGGTGTPIQNINLRTEMELQDLTDLLNQMLYLIKIREKGCFTLDLRS